MNPSHLADTPSIWKSKVMNERTFGKHRLWGIPELQAVNRKIDYKMSPFPRIRTIEISQVQTNQQSDETHVRSFRRIFWQYKVGQTMMNLLDLSWRREVIKCIDMLQEVTQETNNNKVNDSTISICLTHGVLYKQSIHHYEQWSVNIDFSLLCNFY